MKILLTIAYVGTNYCGYQLQGEAPTVALMLNRAARSVFGFDCKITGCSRTDSGVHAIGYRATLESASENHKITAPVDKIPIAMNTALPSDISVTDAMEVPDSFHPRYSVVKKRYLYKIRASRLRDPFSHKRVLEYGREIDASAVEKMKIACAHYIGKHDFSSFMASGSRIEDATRTVYESYITVSGDIIEFHVCADGFLYNMVRIMVGTLLDVSRGKIRAEDIPSIIESRDRKRAGHTAPPDGLYLKRVFYPFEI